MQHQARDAAAGTSALGRLLILLEQKGLSLSPSLSFSHPHVHEANRKKLTSYSWNGPIVLHVVLLTDNQTQEQNQSTANVAAFGRGAKYARQTRTICEKN